MFTEVESDILPRCTFLSSKKTFHNYIADIISQIYKCFFYLSILVNFLKTHIRHVKLRLYNTCIILLETGAYGFEKRFLSQYIGI